MFLFQIIGVHLYLMLNENQKKQEKYFQLGLVVISKTKPHISVIYWLNYWSNKGNESYFSRRSKQIWWRAIGLVVLSIKFKWNVWYSSWNLWFSISLPLFFRKNDAYFSERMMLIFQFQGVCILFSRIFFFKNVYIPLKLSYFSLF